MKQPKKLTRRQKEMISQRGLQPKNWMQLCEDQDRVMLQNKKTSKLRPLYKV